MKKKWWQIQRGLKVQHICCWMCKNVGFSRVHPPPDIEFPNNEMSELFSMKHQIIEHKMKTFPCLAYTHKTWLFQKGERVHVGGRPQKSVSSLSLIEFSYLFVYRWIRADVEERRERLHCHWRAPSRRQPQVNQHFSSSHTHEFLMMDLSKLSLCLFPVSTGSS